MKKILLLLLSTFLCFSLAFSHSGEFPWSFRVNGLYVDEVYDDNFGDEGFGGSAELGFILNGGHTISQIIGLELGYIYSDADFDVLSIANVELETDLIPFFLNLTFVVECETGFILELGAGLGGIIVEQELKASSLMGSGSASDEDVVFGGQVFSRLGFKFTDQLSLLVGARYMGSQKDNISGTRPLDDTVAYDAGLQFKF